MWNSNLMLTQHRLSGRQRPEAEVTSVLNEAGGTKNALMYPQPLHLNENEETARRSLEKFELFTTFFHELWIWILKHFLTSCLHENKQAFSNNHHPFWNSLWDNKNAWSWFCNSWSITKCYLNKNVYFTGSKILFSYLLFSWRVQCSRKGNSLNNSGIIKKKSWKRWRSSLLNVKLFWICNTKSKFSFQILR